MPINRLIRTKGRTGLFWRLTVGKGRGSLTFFGPSMKDVLRKHQAHCRRLQREAILRNVTLGVIGP